MNKHSHAIRLLVILVVLVAVGGIAYAAIGYVQKESYTANVATTSTSAYLPVAPASAKPVATTTPVVSSNPPKLLIVTKADNNTTIQLTQH